MKIRSGFVSNSSSSSFVIYPKKVNENELNTLKVLREFLLQQKEEIYDWISHIQHPTTDEVTTCNSAYDNVLQWIEEFKNTNENPAFIFPSCNYDTYIWKNEDGSIQIDTCNNTNWNKAIETLNADYGYVGGHPDKLNTFQLNPDTKYSDLPILKKPQPKEKKCRFIAILEE